MTERLIRSFRGLGPVLVVLALAGAACGGGGDDEAAPGTTGPPPSSTTAPSVAANAHPLTGLPVDSAQPSRPVLVVKIDNAPKARPQAGVNEADVVVEEGVEGGVTRFAAMFHSRHAPSVGPVRSARSTDLLIARELGRPLFAYSGANAVFADLIRKSPVVDVGINRFPGHYQRKPGRPAPYNLFSDTAALFSAAAGEGTPPPPQFTFRAPGEAPPAEGSEAARPVQAVWKLNITTTVVYRWDEASKTFPRSTDGAPHLDASGVRVAPENVVFQVVNYRDTGLVDRSGAAVPEAELIGEGEAWVLTAGRLVKGRWSRPTEGDITTYRLPSGNPIGLTPGRTWVELVPVGNLKAL